MATEAEGAYSIDFSDPKQVEAHLWIEFPPGVGWAPNRIDVNGRKGRRVVCVFAEDKFHYRIYDLDGSVEIEEAEDAERDTVMRG